MHFRDCDLSFAFMKQNCVIDNSLPPITKKNWSLTFFVIDNQKKFYEIPPGSSCYNFHVFKHIMQTKRARLVISSIRQDEYRPTSSYEKSVKVLKFLLTC